MDSQDSGDRRARKNIGNILTELGFEDTPQSRKLDPWMTAVLARQQQEQEQEQEEEGSSLNMSPALLPDTNDSAIPLKNNQNANDDNQPFIDLDSQNDDGDSVGNGMENLSFKKQQNTSIEIEPPVEKELPVQLRNMILVEMGGSHLLFVTEKALLRTDVAPRQSSLFYFTERQVANEFLNIEEKAKVMDGINVKLMVCNHDYQSGSTEIQVNDINLIRWRNAYALNKTWNPIVQEYELQQDMLVQLWAFRVQSQLYFALVKL